MIFDKTYFEPWIGQKFQTSNPKILTIGDSHYCGGCEICGVRGNLKVEEMEECRYFTINTIKDYLKFRKGERDSAKWMTKTYLPFEKIFYGKETISYDKSVYLWDNIAFINFVQSAASGETSNSYYSYEEYKKSSPIIWSIIKNLSPEIIIVWGNKAYQALPNNNWIKRNNYSGYYYLSDKRIKCMKIWHPSRANIERWHKAIWDFINE